LLEGFGAARVLCIGDVMLDCFVEGRVERVSAEAPVQILRIGSKQTMLGGAGNVARNVAALGARAVLVAVTGVDAAAEEIAELADSEGRLTSRLVAEAGRPSTVKTRYLAEGQQLLRADDETVEAIADETAARVIEAARAELPRADVVVLSDYRKGVLTDAVLATVIAEARAASVPIIADPKREDFSAYSGVDVLKPNRAELELASRLPCETNEAVETAARSAMRGCAIGALLVSRSEHGMSLVPRDAKPLHLPSGAREVRDVSGAGDTVVATAAVAVAAGAELAVAADLANAAGGVVVGTSRTATVSRDALAERLLGSPASVSQAKLHSTNAAILEVERWRERGLRVGLTMGRFDPLGSDDVSLLSEAKSACDRLVVAVHGDCLLPAGGDEAHAMQPESARALVVASLSAVDMVVVTAETPLSSLLGLLRPDVLIRGGGSMPDDGIDGALLRRYDGEVKLAETAPDPGSSGVGVTIFDRRST